MFRLSECPSKKFSSTESGLAAARMNITKQLKVVGEEGRTVAKKRMNENNMVSALVLRILRRGNHHCAGPMSFLKSCLKMGVLPHPRRKSGSIPPTQAKIAINIKNTGFYGDFPAFWG